MRLGVAPRLPVSATLLGPVASATTMHVTVALCPRDPAALAAARAVAHAAPRGPDAVRFEPRVLPDGQVRRADDRREAIQRLIGITVGYQLLRTTAAFRARTLEILVQVIDAAGTVTRLKLRLQPNQ